jgi:pimeloyl-ACP methyl ester carboxylesterase
MATPRKKKSTTVRAPWMVRAAFAAAERIAPGPAAKKLGELWFRLPAGPERRLRGRAPADAAVFTVDTEYGQVWGYERGQGPLVYAIHGWGGSTGDFEFLAGSLVAAGMRVVAMDLPSHGNAGPGPQGERHSNGVHLARAAREVIDKFGQPHGVLAHSLGCLIAVHAMRQSTADLDATRLALIAPFIGGREGFGSTLNSIVPVGPRILERLFPTVEERFGVTIDEIALIDPPVAAPTLVVHDMGDRPNPFRHGKALAEAWPNAELLATTNLGHRRVLTSPAVNSSVVRFLGSVDA